MSKIFDKLMCKRLNNYLGSHNKFLKPQYGLKENSNVVDAIIE